MKSIKTILLIVFIFLFLSAFLYGLFLQRQLIYEKEVNKATWRLLNDSTDSLLHKIDCLYVEIDSLKAELEKYGGDK